MKMSPPRPDRTAGQGDCRMAYLYALNARCKKQNSVLRNLCRLREMEKRYKDNGKRLTSAAKIEVEGRIRLLNAGRPVRSGSFCEDLINIWPRIIFGKCRFTCLLGRRPRVEDDVVELNAGTGTSTRREDGSQPFHSRTLLQLHCSRGGEDMRIRSLNLIGAASYAGYKL